METELWMDEMTAVRRAVHRLLEGELGPLLDLLAVDVEFEVFTGGDRPECTRHSGPQAAEDYFGALGGLVAFWQLDYSATGEQVIAWGRESFTVAGCGLEGGCEFALVFELSEGVITRLVVIDDLSRNSLWAGAGHARGHRTRLERRSGPRTSRPPLAHW